LTLTSGDIVLVDLGLPEGREAGFPRPAVVVSAQYVLDQAPAVVQVVPLTSTRRGFESEVEIQPDARNGLAVASAAQCQHVRSIATSRTGPRIGHVGPLGLAQIRETIAVLLDCR
jgi:mRNA interferase MazF